MPRAALAYFVACKESGFHFFTIAVSATCHSCNEQGGAETFRHSYIRTTLMSTIHSQTHIQSVHTRLSLGSLICMIFQFMPHNIDYAEEWEEGEARAGQGGVSLRAANEFLWCQTKPNQCRQKEKENSLARQFSIPFNCTSISIIIVVQF